MPDSISYQPEHSVFCSPSGTGCILLAKFYDVSTDYLLCMTENRRHINTELSELRLSDEMIGLLKSGNINNRLLCEIATHEKFKTLLADTEIYVDGIATMRFQDLNSLLEMTRQKSLTGTSRKKMILC